MANIRRRFDFYETPPHYVDALQRVIGVPTGRLIEPCAGRGAIIDMLKVDGVWHSNDINRKRNTLWHFDASRHDKWMVPYVPGKKQRPLLWDWGITNPPFGRRVMLPIIRNMLRRCHNVVVLARLSFLEPTIDRLPFWARWQKSCETIVLPRYSFKRVNGKRTTDSVTCCWLIWRNRMPVVDRQLYVSSLQEQRSIQ